MRERATSGGAGGAGPHSLCECCSDRHRRRTCSEFIEDEASCESEREGSSRTTRNDGARTARAVQVQSLCVSLYSSDRARPTRSSWHVLLVPLSPLSPRIAPEQTSSSPSMRCCTTETQTGTRSGSARSGLHSGGTMRSRCVLALILASLPHTLSAGDEADPTSRLGTDRATSRLGRTQSRTRATAARTTGEEGSAERTPGDFERPAGVSGRSVACTARAQEGRQDVRGVVRIRQTPSFSQLITSPLRSVCEMPERTHA